MKKALIAIGIIGLMVTNLQPAFAQVLNENSSMHYRQYIDAKPWYTTSCSNRECKSKALVYNGNSGIWYSTTWSGYSKIATLNLEVPNGNHAHDTAVHCSGNYKMLYKS